jgi:hypothetical protein
MATIQLDLPADLEQFVRNEAKTAGHGEVERSLIDIVRQAQHSKSKADLEASLLIGVEQLDRGDGRPLKSQDWQRLRADYCQRHGMQDEA